MSPASPDTPPSLDRRLVLPSPEATTRFAQRLAPAVGAGDVLLLSGPIGAGKTLFARELIRARLAAAGAPPEDIPSPTFTLVQTYAAGPLEIWHADLYRLTDPSETRELGLDDAFDTALCLVEWPDRMDDRPGALRLGFELGEDESARVLHIEGGPEWARRLSALLEDFADAA